MFHVEQSMNLPFFWTALIFLALIGCKNPLPDPQASDYIYQSIKQELAATESKLGEKKGQLEELKSKLPQTDIQTAEVKMIRAKVDFATQEIRKIEQRVKYWKIKLLSREELVRRKYLAAFNKGEEWDDTLETENFKKSVQRLKSRAPAASNGKPAETPKSSEASGEEEVPASH